MEARLGGTHGKRLTLDILNCTCQTANSFQATQTSRVDSWRSFQKGGKKKKTKTMGLKPPKLKQEKR